MVPILTRRAIKENSARDWTFVQDESSSDEASIFDYEPFVTRARETWVGR